MFALGLSLNLKDQDKLHNIRNILLFADLTWMSKDFKDNEWDKSKSVDKEVVHEKTQ